MRSSRFLAPVLSLILLAACGIDVPLTKSAYVGRWEADRAPALVAFIGGGGFQISISAR